MNFPHSQPAANNLTRKARQRRAEAGPISEEWDIEDHLIALSGRLSPLKAVGVGLLDAAIRMYRVLWPNAETPATADELSRCLMAYEK